MDEAMKNLDDNAEVLNSQFPADRGVKYYNGQYSGVMYSVYTELAENADDAGQQLHYYNSAANSAALYLNSLDIEGENATETSKKAYSEYSVNEAETYIKMAENSGDDSYYDEAERIYGNAETTLGTDDNAAVVYVSHLSYLVDRYSNKFGSDSAAWNASVTRAVRKVYENGNKVPALANGLKQGWQSLSNDLTVKSIVNGSSRSTSE